MAWGSTVGTDVRLSGYKPGLILPVDTQSGTAATVDFIASFLDTNGDGTGTQNAVGNYSATPEIFYIQPPPGVIYKIQKLTILIADYSGNFLGSRYGAIGAGLTNGVIVRVQDNTTTLIDITDGRPIHTNLEWFGIADSYDDIRESSGTAGIRVGIDFFYGNTNLVLDGDSNERLEVVVNDNLTGLDVHTFYAKGVAL